MSCHCTCEHCEAQRDKQLDEEVDFVVKMANSGRHSWARAMARRYIKNLMEPSLFEQLRNSSSKIRIPRLNDS